MNIVLLKILLNILKVSSTRNTITTWLPKLPACLKSHQSSRRRASKIKVPACYPIHLLDKLQNRLWAKSNDKDWWFNFFNRILFIKADANFSMKSAIELTYSIYHSGYVRIFISRCLLILIWRMLSPCIKKGKKKVMYTQSMWYKATYS